MPQIQILPENPGFGTQLAQQLGQGFNKGLEKGIAHGLSQMLNKKKQLSKVPGALRNAFGKDFDKLDPQSRLKVIEQANEATENLGDANLASQYVANNYFNPAEKQGENAISGLAIGNIAKSAEIESPQNKGKWSSPSDTQIPLNFLNEKEPQGFWQRVFQGTGGNVAMQAHALEQQREAIPQSIYGGVEGSTLGAIKPSEPNTEAGKIYRELFKYGGYGKTASRVQGKVEKIIKPTTSGGKLASGAIAGATVSAAQQMINNGEIDPIQLGLDTAIWTGLEGLFVVAPHIMRLFKKPIEDVAKKTGQTAEEVLKAAIEDTKTDFESVLNGNSAEINKLKNRITKEHPVSEKVSKTEKTIFNPKEAIKQRENFAKKVQSSPLAEYFTPEKKVEHKPETLAKQKEITESLTPRLAKLEKEVSADKIDLRQMQLSRKEFSGNDLARVESNILLKERAIQKKMDELKDLNYELKYFRKRPTEAEIDAAVKKSADAYVHEARNPTPDGQKRAQRQLDLDKEYIEKAEQLINRGELPGEIRPDTHIKMKQKYLDGYNAMIQTLREEIRSLKGTRDAESLKKISDSRSAINYLENRARRLKSDIVNQTDKIKAMRGLEGPSGAFYKDQLKGMHRDISQFQHDFFQHIKDKTFKQKITEKSAAIPIRETSKQFQESKRLAEQAIENPSKENMQKIADITGKSTTETADAFREIREAAKKGKEGTSTDADAIRVAKKWKGLIRGGAAIGAGYGVLQGVLEHEFNVKPRQGWLRLFSTATTERLPIIGAVYQITRDLLESSTAKEISKNTKGKVVERFNEIRKLRKKYSTAKANRIMKQIQEFDRENSDK